MSRSGAFGVSGINRILHRVPGEAGRSLVQAYFEAKHPRTSILHPQGQCASIPPLAMFRTPAKPRRWPAPSATALLHRRSFRNGSNAAMTPGFRPQPMDRSTRGGRRRVRHDTESFPLPPFLNATEINNSSAARASYTPRRPYPQAGASQNMTLSHRLNPAYGPAQECTYLPSSNIDYTASTYPSPAPTFGQAPFNSRSTIRF